MDFGFSYIGLIYLLMLSIPNSLWVKYKPRNYDSYTMHENKIFMFFEKVGQILVCTSLIIFRDFNIYQISKWTLWLFVSFLVMTLYEIYWIRYFKSEHELKDFYRSLLGIPLPGATLPVIAFVMLGIYGKNPILIIVSIIFGIGHIGIHKQHVNEIRNNKRLFI